MRRPSDRLHAYEKLSLALRAQGFFVFLLPLSKLASGYKQKSPIALQPGFSLLVRMKGLEPSRDKALVPKTSVSTNFTTSASDPGGARTHDPLIKSEMLFQLSYEILINHIVFCRNGGARTHDLDYIRVLL